jgi:hypothetical protein
VAKVHTTAWRNFKRMQDCACLAAVLIYTAAAIHAWRVLPGALQTKLIFILAAPAIFLALTTLLPVVCGPLRRTLRRYVWRSFQAGAGQTPRSILWSLWLLVLAAAFIYQQVQGVAKGGRYPAGVFSAYAAGIGILLVQAVLVRSLERDPEVAPQIEA